MSFIAAPPAPAPTPIGDEIAGDGWYPALRISAFREAVRVGSSVADPRAREALLGGILSADVALAAWREAQQAFGATTLADVTIRGVAGGTLGGEPRAVILWRRAVHAFAAADLVETHSDISATESGRDRREARAASADELRRDATIALRDLMGRGRAKVALI